MSTYKLTLITPDKELYSGEVKKFKSVNLDGQFEILPGHTRFVTITKPAMTSFTDENGEEKVLFTSTGVVEFSDNNLTFCCDEAEWPKDIDTKRAESAKERAEKRINENSDVDIKRAEIALLRAVTRINIAEKYSK